ncbi:MAG: TonB-dependent receptor [Betaproteobacteria bacterium]|nr:TonB-dependent receptor [Betaproteobacteria bacterium]
MKLKKVSLLFLLLLSSWAIAADRAMLTIPTTAVTGNPLGVGSDQMVVPISILNGRELSLKRESTLAETLNSVPGLSNSSFGSSVGRPMIRGMDSDRIRILQNGVNSIDASNLSFDHAVAIDPLIIEQIDVIRGPATLLYGGGAVGGVINAIDHRIPKEKLQGITGRGEIRYGGANLEQSQAAVIDIGTGNFVMHLDAYHRDGKNYRIPGNAVSNRLQSTAAWNPEEENYTLYSTDHGKRRLLNSQSETKGGAIGASMIFDKGFAGFSYAKHQSVYGSVKEPGVHLDMDRDRYDFSSELKDLNTFFDRAKFKVAYTDYQHHEKEGSEIHTTFKNAVTDGTFELGHKPIAGLQGVLGVQFDHGKFNAIGHEAFVPNSRTNSQSVYVYEELPLEKHKVTFGLRHGKHDVENKGGEGSDHGNHFSDPTAKKFNTNNAAIGGLYALNDQWSLTGNISHNERAPTYFELFANGLHKATGVYEEGQADLKKEKSNGIDGQIRWKSGQDSLTFGAYFNRFSNFIGLLSTNEPKVVEHEHDGEHHEITYQKSRFTGIKAEFKGIELEGKTMLTDYLQFNLRADYVDAKDKTNGGYVPRISPLKLGAGLKYEFDSFGARLDVLHAFRQDRVATNYNYEGNKELITDGYTNVSMMATYKLPTQYNLEAFTRANNLLDEEIREHASFLKDIAPMGGRSLMIGLRGEF